MGVEGTHVRIAERASRAATTWTSYTPTITQGVSVNIAKTTTYSKYTKSGPSGKTITWSFAFATTAAGTAGSAITLTLPVNAAAPANIVLGTGTISDVSGGAAGSYNGMWKMASTSTIGLIRDSANNFVGATPSFALASTDEILGFLVYEGV